MAASDATPFPIKNQAYRVTFPILDADGDLVTGATGLDSEVSKDGGTFADCTSEATEIATSSGVYYLDLTATEMNADTVAIIVKSSTSGAKTTTIVLYPITNGLDIPVNTTYIGGTAQTAGDLKTLIDTLTAYVDTEVAAIKAKTDNLPTDPADASDIAASFSSISSTLSTIAGYLDTEVAAIKAKTDNLPADPADASDIAASFSSISSTLSTIAGYLDTEVAAIKAKTDNLPADPADASDIAASFASITSTLSTIAGYLDTEVAAIKAKTDNLPAAPAATGDIPSASSIASAVLTSQLADVYAANGVAPTTQQALMAVHQYLMSKAVQGVDLTVYKLDGSTEAFVVTLDDDTAPTSGIRE